MQELLKDMQFGARLIKRAPWFAGLVVLTLALGIGANTAIFSLIRGVLLEPLPYLEGERLVLIKQAAPGIGVQNANVSIKETSPIASRRGTSNRSSSTIRCRSTC